MIIPIAQDKHLYTHRKAHKKQSALPKIWEEAQAKGIEFLDLSYNQFTDLKCDTQIDALRVLDISYNESSLQSVRINGDKLPALQHLYLYKSKIKNLSLEGRFPNLETLHFAENELSEFQINVGNFPALKTLYLYKNPITNIPAETFDKKRENVWEGVRNFLQALATGSVINHEAKIILIGNGSAGKTTLSHQLRTGEFVEIAEEDRTHGVVPEKWTILQKDFPESLKQNIQATIEKHHKENPKEEKKLTMPDSLLLNLWDFGGQEYYHATHRLFLNSNALYLLLWEEASNSYKTYIDKKGLPQENQHFDYWRANIKAYSKDKNSTLLVKNKHPQEGTCNVGGMQYKIAFYNKKDSESVEEYERDIKKLKRGILQELAHIGNFAKPFPEIYQHLKNELAKIEKPYLSFAEYVQFCRENDNTPSKIMQDESHIKTLTELLDETGAIICYKYRQDYSEDLKSYVFINPEWLVKHIYQILDASLQGTGEFDIAHVAQKVSDLKPTIWIELMQKFELIFENKAKTCYIIPQYLPIKYNDQKGYNWAFKNKKMAVSFTLSFPTFMPKSLFLRLIAHFGAAHIDNLYWKSGLVFDLMEKVVLAECEYEKKKIHIQIENNDIAVAKEIFDWLRDKIYADTLILVGDKHKTWEELQNANDFSDEIKQTFAFALQDKEHFFLSDKTQAREVKVFKDDLYRQLAEGDSIADILIAIEESGYRYDTEAWKQINKDSFAKNTSPHEQVEHTKLLIHSVKEM